MAKNAPASEKQLVRERPASALVVCMIADIVGLGRLRSTFCASDSSIIYNTYVHSVLSVATTVANQVWLPLGFNRFPLI